MPKGCRIADFSDIAFSMEEPEKVVEVVMAYITGQVSREVQRVIDLAKGSDYVGMRAAESLTSPSASQMRGGKKGR